MDGASTSVSYPEIFIITMPWADQLLKRIPKPTTALEAVIKVIPELDINYFNAISFRTPTEIVEC